MKPLPNTMDLKDSWPERSLEKALVRDYPGCKDLKSALKQEIEKLNPRQEDLGLLWTQVVEALKEESENFDYSKISQEERQILSQMPLNSTHAIKAWGKAWHTIFKR